MKKLFLFSFIFSLLFLGMVSASSRVNYVFFDSNYNQANNVEGLVLVCSDDTCSKVNVPVTFPLAYTSGEHNVLTIPYPTYLEGKHYAVYFYKEGYSPIELKTNYRGDLDKPVTIDNNFFLKKNDCRINIAALDLTTPEKDKAVNIIAKGLNSSLIRFKSEGEIPEYIPPEYKNKYYSLNSNVVLTILKDGVSVHTETKPLLSLLNAVDNIEFAYTPKDYGKYNINIETNVNDNKCSSSIKGTATKEVVLTSPVVVEDNKPPVAAFTFSPEEIKAGDVVVFDGLTSKDEDGTISKYVWTYGDGSGAAKTGEGNKITVTYTKAGSFNMFLQVTDNKGATGVTQKSIVVKEVIQPPVIAADFNVVEESLDVNVARGSKTTKEITIENKNDFNLTSFTGSFKLDKTIDGSISVKVLAGVITAGTSGKLGFEIAASDNIDVDEYTGVMTIARGDKTDSFVLNVNVQPDICESGSKGSELKITINDPKKGKDFKPGQKMEIDIDVKNTAGRDMDVGVEAELWNVKTGNVLASVSADTTEIEKNKKESFTMELEVPSNDDVNEKDDIVLFVRAFEDDDEENVCSYESKELDVKREDYDVMIDDFVITPASLSCGQRNINFRVGVENIGNRKDDSVEIVITSEALGIGLKEGPFTLKEFDESDNSAVRGLSFTLPKNVEAGTYGVTLDVMFNDGKNRASLIKEIIVNDCAGSQGLSPSLLSLFDEEETISNENVVQPKEFSLGFLGGDNLIIGLLIFGIVLVLVVIVYSVKVLAR